jgi:cell wall-associated NlpC family hydrolase
MRTIHSLCSTLVSVVAPLRRGAALIACAGSALLAGCAGTQPPQQTSSIEWERYSSGYDWKSSNDPIGALVTRLRKGTNYVPGEVNNPLAAHALSQLGIRYRFGGKSPDTGFDCSGLVGYSAQQSLGLKLPPRADDIAKLGNNVQRSDLQVGDLVFFNTMGKRYSHVGVYIGDSKFVHSPARGGVVRVEDMNERYWTTRFTGARRLDQTEVANNR